MSNPFEDNDTQNPRATATVSTMRNTNNNSSLQERAEQLRRREEDIIRREQMLEQRNQILLEREAANPRKPNWPVCRPWIYHDIAADIPDQFQKHVKLGYANWIADTILLIWNFVCLIARISVSSSGPAIADFILSIVFFFALSPIIFFIYRLLYRGARKTKKSLFLAYLCFYFLNILIHLFFAIGVSGTGAGGFFVMLNMFNDDHTAVGIMLLVAFILWVIMSVFSIYHFIHIRIIYGRLGGDIKKEATNKAVQEAKNHPELFVEGAKTAAEHPELFSTTAKAVV